MSRYNLVIKDKVSGITLTEVLVYLGVFAIVFLGIIQFLFYVGENNSEAEEKHELQKSIILIDEHLNNSFKASSTINEASSIFANDNGTIRLEEAATYIEYSIVNGRLNFNNNGVSTSVSPAIYDITKFRLEKILDSQDNLVGVRVEYEIVSTKNSNLIREFQTSYLLK